MERKGRPEKLDDELQQWIYNHQKGRKKKLKGPAIRNDMRLYIEEQLRIEIEKHHVHFHNEEAIQKEIDKRLPGLSAIQKFLAPINEHLDNPQLLDTPWHTGTLKEYELTPSGIEMIIDIKSKVRYASTMTIREAQWVSRLSNFTLSSEVIYFQARLYAFREVVSEFAGNKTVDNSQFDKLLIQAYKHPNSTLGKLELDEDEKSMIKATQDELSLLKLSEKELANLNLNEDDKNLLKRDKEALTSNFEIDEEDLPSLDFRKGGRNEKKIKEGETK